GISRTRSLEASEVVTKSERVRFCVVRLYAAVVAKCVARTSRPDAGGGRRNLAGLDTAGKMCRRRCSVHLGKRTGKSEQVAAGRCPMTHLSCMITRKAVCGHRSRRQPIRCSEYRGQDMDTKQYTRTDACFSIEWKFDSAADVQPFPDALGGRGRSSDLH